MNERTLDTLARLNKLQLLPEERQRLLQDFGCLLSSFDALTHIDTAGTDPLVHVIPLNTAMREDNVSIEVSRDAILANAPEHTQGCFLAPKILE